MHVGRGWSERTHLVKEQTGRREASETDVAKKKRWLRDGGKSACENSRSHQVAVTK